MHTFGPDVHAMQQPVYAHFCAIYIYFNSLTLLSKMTYNWNLQIAQGPNHGSWPSNQ